MVVDNLPFKEKVLEENENYILVKREFDSHLDSKDLVWHRDKEDRTIHILEGLNWMLQMDNEEPFELVKGKSYFIPKMEYHRIIKGEESLIIEIEVKHVD